MRHHVGRVPNGGQVVDLVPFLDQVQIAQECARLRLGQGQMLGVGGAHQCDPGVNGGVGHDQEVPGDRVIVACRTRQASHEREWPRFAGIQVSRRARLDLQVSRETIHCYPPLSQQLPFWSPIWTQ